MTTDQEEQIANAIVGSVCKCRPNRHVRGYPECATARNAAVDILAAVNSGKCDPIVPEGKVVVGSVTDGLDLIAELAELRTLKAKIDGWEHSDD